MASIIPETTAEEVAETASTAFETPEQAPEAPIANQTPVQQETVEPEKAEEGANQTEASEGTEAPKEEKAEEPSEPEKAEKEDKAEKSDGKLDLKLRPNSPLNDQHVADIKALAEEYGLNQDQAQALLDQEAQREADLRDFNQQQSDEWFEEIQRDPDLGGDNFDRTQNRAKQALTAFWSNEFIQMLRETGLGNEPEFVRGLDKLGARLSEPQHIARGAESAKGGSATWETLFPNSPRPDAAGVASS